MVLGPMQRQVLLDPLQVAVVETNSHYPRRYKERSLTRRRREELLGRCDHGGVNLFPADDSSCDVRQYRTVCPLGITRRKGLNGRCDRSSPNVWTVTPPFS